MSRYEYTRSPNPSHGYYAVINEWNDGRKIIVLVWAESPLEAAEAKTAHLKATSNQSNNKVVAVSEKPVPYILHPDETNLSGVGLMNVIEEEIPPPPPPKRMKIRGYYGKQGFRYRDREDQIAARRIMDTDTYGRPWGT